MYLITKEMKPFAAAHNLVKHDGGCANLHGHNYGVFITLTGDLIPHYAELPSASMIMDFTRVKELYEERIHNIIDHAYILGKEWPAWYEQFVTLYQNTHGKSREFAQAGVDELLGKVAHIDMHHTTAEELARWIFVEMSQAISDEYAKYPLMERLPVVHSVKVYETPSSYATFVHPDYSGVYDGSS